MSGPGECVFIIIGAPRTGTTMLGSMINSHPDAIVGGEILNDVLIAEDGEIFWPRKSAHHERVLHDPELKRLRREDSHAFLDAIGGLARSEGFRVFGFKVLYPHGHHSPHAMEYMASLGDVAVLHIRRRDRLARLVSLRRAERSGQWYMGREDERKDLESLLEISPEECQLFFEKEDKDIDAYERMFSNSRTLDLWYEDVAADLATWSRQVQEFLRLEPREIESWTTKQARATPRESLANYDELKSHFAGTEWASLFGE